MSLRINQDLLQWIIILIILTINISSNAIKYLFETYIQHIYTKKEYTLRDIIELKRTKKIEKFRKDYKLLEDLWETIYSCIIKWNSLGFPNSEKEHQENESAFAEEYDTLNELYSKNIPFIPEILSTEIDNLITAINDRKSTLEYSYNFDKEINKIVDIYRSLLNI